MQSAPSCWQLTTAHWQQPDTDTSPAKAADIKVSPPVPVRTEPTLPKKSRLVGRAKLRLSRDRGGRFHFLEERIGDFNPYEFRSH
jgi:hypothetical protein